MEKRSVFVAGAGGIGSAVCLLLREAEMRHWVIAGHRRIPEFPEHGFLVNFK